MKGKVIWTIGHSTHSQEEFIRLLKSFDLELLADIRSLPGSKRYPHFNKEILEDSLAKNDIRYLHLKDLGGRRKTSKDSKNPGWRKDSFRGYADYAETDEFKKALKELEEISLKNRTAVMCAEALWWRCHRSIVSDYLKLKGWKVTHITGQGKSEEHPYTQPARIINGKISYPENL